MKVNSRATETIDECSVKNDNAVLEVIAKLGLKNKQQISEDDLLTVIKALYPKDYQTKLETLLNSKYLKAFYVVDLR